MAVVALAIVGAPGADAACRGPVPPSAELDAGARQGINVLKATYETVASRAQLPWAALAAIDYRESGNDPHRSALAGEPLGSANPDHPDVVTATKEDSLQRAAESLKALAASVYGVALGPTSSGQDMQLAFLAYNRGAIYRQAGVGPEASPYVMNQADAAHTGHDVARHPRRAAGRAHRVRPLRGVDDLRPPRRRRR